MATKNTFDPASFLENLDLKKLAQVNRESYVNPRANRKTLRLLDIVRTKTGVLAVVAEKSGKNASLAFANNYGGKIAWYAPNELEVIGNVVDLVATLKIG